MYADNIDFSGNVVQSSNITQDGQLLIGAGTAPHIRPGFLTAGTGITITNTPGGIEIDSVGTGDVTGPASSTLNAIATYADTTGKLIQNSVPTIDSTGNLSISTAVSGGSLSATVANTSNTASATASYLAQVAGTTAADAYYTAGISGGQNYSWGVDNSVATDPLVISDSTNPSAGNTLVTMFPTNNNFRFGYSLDSNENLLELRNLGTTSASATVAALVGASSTGDACLRCDLAAVRSYCVGIDNSDSDILKINTTASSGVTPSSGTNLWNMTSAGERTMPLQPYVLATTVTAITDATGDGTAVNVIFDNEIADQNSDYVIGTNIFTAPVTGRYRFNGSMSIAGLLSTHTSGEVILIASNRNLRAWQLSPFACAQGGTTLTFPFSLGIDMDAADTANMRLVVSNGTKVVDIQGSATTNAYGSLEIILEV